MTARLLKSLLRSASVAATAAAPSSTLYDILVAASIAQVEANKSGLLLTSTTGNGHQVQFSIPASGAWATPLEVLESYERLLELYADANAALVATGVTPTDAQLTSEILARLTPVKSLSASDFTNLRG